MCEGCEAADYPCKVLKGFDGSMLHAKYTLERVSGGMTQGKFLNFGSLRVHLLAIYISRHKLTVFAHRLILHLTSYVVRTARLAQRVSSWATRYGISCMDLPHPLRGYLLYMAGLGEGIYSYNML